MTTKLIRLLGLMACLMTSAVYAQDHVAYTQDMVGDDHAYATAPCYVVCQKPHDFTYIKMGGGFVHSGRGYTFGPALGLGHRFDRGNAAIDLSINWAGNDRETYYSIPKVVYLRYVDATAPSSYYYGAGLSLGGNTGHHAKRFAGVMAEFVGGYETYVDNIKTFFEANLSQGFIPFKSTYHYNMPTLTFTVGVGF